MGRIETITENKHAVHLLADPKRQVKISQSELLKINGYKKESDHLMADLRAGQLRFSIRKPTKRSPESLSAA